MFSHSTPHLRDLGRALRARARRLVLTFIIAGSAVGAPALTAQTTETADVLGVVTNAATGNFVERARVEVVGTNRTALTDSSGRYYIGGLPPGDYLVRISSSGTESQTVPVTLAPGRNQTLQVALDSPVVMMESVMVSGQAEGQAQALNSQRESDSIRKVVSQDALAVARAGEVGEALQSLSGVYLEYSTHQPARPVIRGLQSEFNSLTIDGVRAGNTNADRRDGVSTFPAEALQRVELYKSVTPDRNGDSIGGAINLVSRRPFDLAEPLLDFTVGTTYNDQLRNFDKEFAFNYGSKFSSDRLGVLLSVSHYRSDRGYHDSVITYSVNANDEFAVNGLTLLDRIEDDSWKAKISTSVQYRVSDQSTLTFSSFYSNNTRALEDHRYVLSGGSRVFLTPDTGTASGARMSLQRRYREPESIGAQFSLGMEHNLDLWQLDYSAAYTPSRNSYKESFYPDVRTAATTFSYDRSDRRFPAFTPTGTVNLNDPAAYSVNAFERSQGPTEEDLYTAIFNARRDMPAWSESAYVKFGGTITRRDWQQRADRLGSWRYTGPLPASAFLSPRDEPRFLDEAGGRLLVPKIAVDLDPVFEAFYERPEEFTRRDFESDLLIAQRIQDITEDIGAVYGMASIRFGALNLLGGVRVEQTAYKGTANRIEQTSTSIISVTPQTNTLDDTQVLPGVHFNYYLTPSFILRGAIYKTLARPAGADLLPALSIDETALRVTRGNPDLDVTESVNYDLSLEYYLQPIGVLSLGAFRKDIDGFYVDRTSTIEGGQYDGYTLAQPEMGNNGKVQGVELEWQQRLAFLPGLFSSISIGSNVTLIDSSGGYDNRPDADLTLFGTAEQIANANVSFARGGFDLRLFYNWRDDFLTGVGGREALDTYQEGRETFDVYARYKPQGSRLSYVLSGKNLANAPLVTFQGSAENPRSVRYFDWSLSASVRLEL